MQNYRSIARTTMFLIAFVCAAVAAALPDTMGPMAAVRQYIDAFNNGDVEAMAGICARVNEHTGRTWRPTSGRDRQLAGIGTETCWRPARKKVRRDISSLSASHGMSM